MAYTLTKPAPRKGDLTPKNRVWQIFSESNNSRPRNRRQVQQLHRKNRPTPTKTVSGIPVWPSRDPIGERGGINLYGFVGNDGVNKWDILGNVSYTPKSVRIRGKNGEGSFHGDYAREEVDYGSSKLAAIAIIGYDDVGGCPNSRIITASGLAVFPSKGKEGDRNEWLDENPITWGDTNAGLKVTATANKIDVTPEENPVYETYKHIVKEGHSFHIGLRVVYKSGSEATITVVVSVLASIDENARPDGNGIFDWGAVAAGGLGITWPDTTVPYGTVKAKAVMKIRPKCCN